MGTRWARLPVLGRHRVAGCQGSRLLDAGTDVVVTPKEVEIALSVALARWFSRSYPNEDVETTRLEELGEDEAGIMLTVGDCEFRIMVESS